MKFEGIALDVWQVEDWEKQQFYDFRAVRRIVQHCVARSFLKFGAATAAAVTRFRPVGMQNSVKLCCKIQSSWSAKFIPLGLENY